MLQDLAPFEHDACKSVVEWFAGSLADGFVYLGRGRGGDVEGGIFSHVAPGLDGASGVVGGSGAVDASAGAVGAAGGLGDTIGGLGEAVCCG